MMALERVPADIRKQGGVARMSDPKVDYIVLFLMKIRSSACSRTRSTWWSCGV